MLCALAAEIRPLAALDLRPTRITDAGAFPGETWTVATGGGADGRSDIDLVEDPTDIEALVAEHSGSVYRLALSIVRDPAQAEDITQDTMLQVWLHADDYRGDAPLRHWILRIAHNTAISSLRRRQDTPMAEPHALNAAQPSSVEGTVVRRAAVANVWEAVAELDELSRSIVVLREIEGMSYDEIAAALEIPVPTVKTRLHRARRMLASTLEGWRS
jgi:RNA polymerase sigma-70 factor (ECF subfamily)